LLVGLGKYFDPVPSYMMNESYDDPVWLGVAAVKSKTNHGGTQTAYGFSVEAKRYYGQWAASIIGIVEGDDEVRLDRNGIGVQGWFVQPLNGKWTASAGVGPYLARNKRGSGDAQAYGIFTIQLDRTIGKTWKAFASFSRTTDFSGQNDRDLIRAGIMARLGG
jgi:hypothetical protein